MAKHKAIFAVKNFESQGEERSNWTRIGTAFVNSDGSENLVFDFFPTDPAMTIQVREIKEREDEAQ